MIVVHNEEKVIIDKLSNVIEIDYLSDKIEFFVASDYSTDLTNVLVCDFIERHPNNIIKLYVVKSRKEKLISKEYDFDLLVIKLVRVIEHVQRG